MRLPITEQPDFLSRVSGRSEATAEALDWLYANVVPALKCVAKSARCCEQDTKKSRIGSARAAEEAQLLKRCSVHSRSRARRRIRKEKKKKMRGWATERKRERRCSQDITLWMSFLNAFLACPNRWELLVLTLFLIWYYSFSFLAFSSCSRLYNDHWYGEEMSLNGFYAHWQRHGIEVGGQVSVMPQWRKKWKPI